MGSKEGPAMIFAINSNHIVRFEYVESEQKMSVHYSIRNQQRVDFFKIASSEEAKNAA